MVPEVRASSTVKGSPLTYLELDSNFKLIDDALIGLKEGTGLDDGSVGSNKLVNTAVSAGSYGNSTSVPSFTVNSKGQVTAAANLSISYPIASYQYAVYTANEDITTVIPLDDTIPQASEGTEVLSVTITPKQSTNRIVVSVSGFGSLFDVGHIVMALFVDSGPNAFAASAKYVSTPDELENVNLVGEFIAGMTIPRTISLRVGADVTNTLSLNGNTNGRFFGGSAGLSLSVTEYTI
jgi:hypothetical protein